MVILRLLAVLAGVAFYVGVRLVCFTYFFGYPLEAAWWPPKDGRAFGDWWLSWWIAIIGTIVAGGLIGGTIAALGWIFLFGYEPKAPAPPPKPLPKQRGTFQ